MSDRQALLAMFDRANIVYEIDYEPGAETIRAGETLEYAARLTVREGKPPNLGYTDFLTIFFFDADGALLAMGAWE